MSGPRDLACPSCGAALPPEAIDVAVTCAFCGRTAAPPAEDTERMDEPAFTAAPAERGPRCPRCARDLDEVRSAAKRVHACRGCGGVWLDTETTDYLRAVRDPDLETAVRRAVSAVVSLTPRQRDQSVFCPACEAQARRVEIASTAHAIDVCDAHGAWFDRDELSLFVQAGTDPRARETLETELEAAGVSGGAAGWSEGGFFTGLLRALFPKARAP